MSRLTSYLTKRLNCKFWQQLLLITGISLLSAYLVNRTSHLYIDNQRETSISNRHYYVINHWSSLPHNGVLSVYKAYYQKLTPQQQQEFRDYTYKVWENHQSLSLINLWLAQYFPLNSQTVSSLDQMLTPFANLPTAYYLNAFESSIYGITNQKLVPSLHPQQSLVKYVVGQPGDIVTITSQGSYINGVFIKAYLPEVSTQVTKKLSVKEFTLASNQYWVMGDNPKSIDSNLFGPVDAKQIFGKVWWSK